MSIPDHARANFTTLLRAAADGNLALMECADAATGEPRYVICAVGRDGTDSCSHRSAISPTAILSIPTCRRPQPCRTSRLPDPSRPWPVWTRQLAGQRTSRFRIARDA